mmetsp:Transcript_18854/g.38088  ORF Transcript_18854/g.38088 Transcript_18854/m.38088 type:complete len:869 (+) Transcript_18854:207-2813(+)
MADLNAATGELGASNRDSVGARGSDAKMVQFGGSVNTDEKLPHISNAQHGGTTLRDMKGIEDFYATNLDELMEIHGPLSGPKYPRYRDLVKALEDECHQVRQEMNKIKEERKTDTELDEEPKLTNENRAGCDYGYAYTLSVRVRFGLIILLSLCLTFCCMVSFVLTILFSTILRDSTTDEKWGLRIGVFLPLAPLILILGSLLCDELLEMFIDAISYFPLHQYRVKLAAIIYYTYGWIIGDGETIKKEEYSQLRLSHLRIMEFLMPGVIEIVGFMAVMISLCRGESLFEVFSQYLSQTVVFTCFFGLLSPILTVLVYNHTGIHNVWLRLHRDAPAVNSRILHAEIYPYVDRDDDPSKLKRRSSTANLRVKNFRVLNLLRYCVPYGMCYKRKTDRCCYSLCNAWTQCFECWHRTVPWGVRLAIDIGLYIMFACLSLVDSVPTGIRWFMVVFFICMIGFKFYERYPYIFGWFYNAILIFFVCSTFLYFCLAVAQPSLDSEINITAPTVANAQSIQAVPLDAQTPGYPVCKQTWGGLTALDLALLADNAYAATTTRRQENMERAFNGTALQNFTIIKEESDERTIHFYHVHFPDQGIDVVSVRGTSTDEEAFTDTYLYSTISIFQAINVWIPFIEVFPNTYIRDIVGFLALSSISGSQPYKWTQDYVANLKSEGRKPIVTGHSLGGAIGGIVGVSNEVPGLYFSPPGMFYSSERFGLTVDNIMLYNSVIVPQKDAIPRVDEQWGSVQAIKCDQSTLACHSISQTACTLLSHCGDQRMRGWDDYCPETKPDDSVSTVQIIGYTLVGILGIILLYALYKLRFRMCPKCFKKEPSAQQQTGLGDDKKRGSVDHEAGLGNVFGEGNTTDVGAPVM